MLPLPSKGVRPSAEKHNSRVDVLADWIEGSAVFGEARISVADIKDGLCEHEVYTSQDFAAEFVEILWQELRRRINRGKLLATLAIDGRGIQAAGPWQDSPAYAFCLILALKDWYSVGERDYTEQGELFEKLTERSLQAHGWRLLRTGWSATKVNRLRSTVEAIAAHLGEPEIAGGVGRWTKPDAKDAGLDLVCDRPFADERGGRPLFFVQCASGADWGQKVYTPDLRLWGQLIDFSNSPIRGFALPYALGDDDFRRTVSRVNGMVLDRLRLVAVSEEADDWLTAELESELVGWVRSRVDDLQRRGAVGVREG